MTGLDKIIEHIKQDAQATADAKIAEAKAEAQELLAKAAEEEKELLAFYPDEGAMKRYSSMIEMPYAFGIKKRDWTTGKIEGLDVAGSVDKIKEVLEMMYKELKENYRSFEPFNLEAQKDALFEFVTTDKTVTEISLKHYVSETKLYRLHNGNAYIVVPLQNSYS